MKDASDGSGIKITIVVCEDMNKSETQVMILKEVPYSCQLIAQIMSSAEEVIPQLPNPGA